MKTADEIVDETVCPVSLLMFFAVSFLTFLF